jgi:hypothetical protein
MKMLFGAVVLLLLFIIGYSLHRKWGKEGLVGYMAGTDFPGNDLTSLSETTMSDCWTDCSNNSSCVAMIGSVGSMSESGTCWLKSSVDTTTPTVNSERFTWLKDSGVPDFGAAAVQCANDASGGSVYRLDASNTLFSYGSADTMQTWTNSGPGPTVDCTGLTTAPNLLQPYSPDANWTVQSGTDYPSDGNIATLSGATSDSCKASCLSTAGCLNFVLDGSQNCYLKGVVTTPVPTTGSDTYALTLVPGPPPPPPVWADASGVDFPGNDLGPVPSYSPQDCQTPCQDASGCVGFMYDASGQQCYLKSAMSSSVASPGAQAYFLNPVMSWSIQSDTDFPGNDGLGTMQGTTPQACQTACSTAPGCKGFVFDNTAQQCYLKTSMTTGSNAASGLDGYIMTPAAVVAGSSASNIDDDVPLVENRPLFRYFLKKKYGA